MAGEFRARLKRGEKLLGTMVTLASPVAAEILSGVGFDWLFVDGEHGPLDSGDILGILQAADPRVACVVRVPASDGVRACMSACTRRCMSWCVKTQRCVHVRVCARARVRVYVPERVCARTGTRVCVHVCTRAVRGS